MLYSYNQHASDVRSRVALLITISPMVIANTEIARNRNSESGLPLLCIGSCCSQCKPTELLAVGDSHSFLLYGFCLPRACNAGLSHTRTTRLCCNTGRISKCVMLPGSTTVQVCVIHQSACNSVRTVCERDVTATGQTKETHHKINPATAPSASTEYMIQWG